MVKYQVYMVGKDARIKGKREIVIEENETSVKMMGGRNDICESIIIIIIIIIIFISTTTTSSSSSSWCFSCSNSTYSSGGGNIVLWFRFF